MGIVDDLSDSGKRIVGLKQVIKHAEGLKCSKVFIANDADETIILKLKETCERFGIEYDMSHTMLEIGSASGIEVDSACAAVKL